MFSEDELDHSTVRMLLAKSIRKRIDSVMRSNRMHPILGNENPSARSADGRWMVMLRARSGAAVRRARDRLMVIAADAGDAARGGRGRSSVLPGKLAPGKVVPRTSWMKTTPAVRELTSRRESFHRSSVDSHHCLRRGFGAWSAARCRRGSQQREGARESKKRAREAGAHR